MKIKLIAVGTQMPKWVIEGFNDYQKRLPHPYKLELIEIPLQKRSKSVDSQKQIEQEGKQMLSHVANHDLCITLEIKGKNWSTEQLSQQMADWTQMGCDIALLIGGPEGLAQSCIERSDQKWSLSPLTLPHPLVRILLAEQLYRAWSILQGHPYHR